MIEQNDEESNYRAKIILLKDEGYAGPEIRKMTKYHHDVNIRKWIHRFNEKGIEGIISRKHIHKPIKISDNIEKKIVEIASQESKRLLSVAILHMVITSCSCRIHIQ